VNEETRDPELPERIAAVLRGPDVWSEVPDDLDARVLTALRRERASGIAAPDKVFTPAPAVPRDELARARKHRAARRSRRGLLIVSAAATVAAAAAAVAVLSILPDDGASSNVVTLTATALAPGASGHATVTDRPSGVEIELDLEGLAPSRRGSYYQGWLKGPNGAVTIGTFHARDGAKDVVLWSGVDVADYPTLTVTVQREGAGPESSRKVVLEGRVG